MGKFDAIGRHDMKSRCGEISLNYVVIISPFCNFRFYISCSKKEKKGFYISILAKFTVLAFFVAGLFSNHGPLYFVSTKTSFSKLGLTCHIAKIHSEVHLVSIQFHSYFLVYTEVDNY